jgi:hypothetical protein
MSALTWRPAGLPGASFLALIGRALYSRLEFTDGGLGYAILQAPVR